MFHIDPPPSALRCEHCDNRGSVRERRFLPPDDVRKARELGIFDGDPGYQVDAPCPVCHPMGPA